MKFAKRTRRLVAACVVGFVAAAPARADDVLKGSDGWTTPCTTMTLNDSIPADFFGPGSDPLNTLEVCGDPIVNGIDTIIERLDDAVLPACGDQATVDLEIVALSLAGTATVTFNGGQDPETWGVKVCLSACHVNPAAGALCPAAGALIGELLIRKECTGGGTADTLRLPVSPKFIFTDPTAAPGTPPSILDAGLDGYVPDELVGSGMGWSHTGATSTIPAGTPLDSDCDGSADRNALGSSNFVAGQQPAGCTCGGGDSTQMCKKLSSESLRLLRHKVLPGGTEIVGCCLPTGPCKSLTMEECIEKGGDGVVMVDEGKCNSFRGCCFPDGTCQDMAPGCCECKGGAPQNQGDLCKGDLNGDGIDDLCQEFIPTVSQWGLAMLALLLLVGARVYYSKRRSVTA